MTQLTHPLCWFRLVIVLLSRAPLQIASQVIREISHLKQKRQNKVVNLCQLRPELWAALFWHPKSWRIILLHLPRPQDLQFGSSTATPNPTNSQSSATQMTKVGVILSLCSTVQENWRANWLTLSYPAFLTWMAQDIAGDGLSYTRRGNSGYTPI